MENQPMDLIIGLDLLKRHQCQIDLKNNQLMIGSTGTLKGIYNDEFEYKLFIGCLRKFSILID
jgi:hypothetical protein